MKSVILLCVFVCASADSQSDSSEKECDALHELGCTGRLSQQIPELDFTNGADLLATTRSYVNTTKQLKHFCMEYNLYRDCLGDMEEDCFDLERLLNENGQDVKLAALDAMVHGFLITMCGTEFNKLYKHYDQQLEVYNTQAEEINKLEAGFLEEAFPVSKEVSCPAGQTLMDRVALLFKPTSEKLAKINCKCYEVAIKSGVPLCKKLVEC